MEETKEELTEIIDLGDEKIVLGHVIDGDTIAIKVDFIKQTGEKDEDGRDLFTGIGFLFPEAIAEKLAKGIQNAIKAARSPKENEGGKVIQLQFPKL